ncbi:tRNA-uridine aminocarboxypropyltransferase [Glaciecola petra]|uniref:tRNA-uridine aminocarboxypropyltransferase n=1 Tax=Glaciecola petra TaxID=3075602 RepID=A0ABU2ZQ78_9ALTE|nr:tRNA-uridine aminocarboxypropyltransferase [Aestuariibacter sp. P117]MDT0594778.1 tRNA-uridine aminocarboxypropyltransferase [Aestuariibacter sp. P117]
MYRDYCTQCRYPINTCVCHAIEPVHITTNVYIFQHPKEKRHAKSTVRLLHLLSANIKVINAKDKESVDLLLSQLNTEDTAIIYPNPNSVALDIKSNSTVENDIKNLLVIDGSWSQAYSIFNQNQNFNKFKSYHFDSPPKQKFIIRKAKRAEQLSTLEAVAYSLKNIEGLDERPFLFLFDEMQKHWLNHIK